MNTLILYGSRKGCTRACAERLRDQGAGGDVIDVRKARTVDLSRYDTVVLGSSIWAGKVHPGARRFAERHLSTLLTKRVGLNICSGDERKDYVRANYPAELVEHAALTAHFGGVLCIQDFGHVMRFVLAKKAGVTESYNRLKPEVIARFAQLLRSGSVVGAHRSSRRPGTSRMQGSILKRGSSCS